jgi:tetraacyldisaccharide 4'-kinase
MREAIVRVWRGELPFVRWLFAPLLLVGSLVYRVCLKVRESLYDRGLFHTHVIPVPVISVGNITLGGTGKTPVVEKIALWLKREGYRPVIVTRGYGRKRGGVFVVDGASDRAVDAGDEPLMLARKTGVPVVVGADRTEAIALGMREFESDVIVMDDGFQRRDIVKDVDLLVLNGGVSRSDLRLFPLGSLREPMRRIGEADMILVNKGDVPEAMKPLAGGNPSFRMGYRPVHLINMRRKFIGRHGYLRGKKVLAFSGLGDNESFFATIATLGADVVQKVSFPDHHRYSARDMEMLRSHRDVDLVVTTEKDAIKIEGTHCPGNFFYLTIEAEIEGAEAFFQMLADRLEASKRALSKH